MGKIAHEAAELREEALGNANSSNREPGYDRYLGLLLLANVVDALCLIAEAIEQHERGNNAQL